MRSGMSPEDYLRAVALKKPRLQALIDQLDQMSHLDIKGLSEPLWVREALFKLKSSDGTTQKERLEIMIQRVIEAEEAAAKLPPPTFEVRLWTSSSEFIGRERSHGSHSWQIEITTNDTFVFLEDFIRVGDSVLSFEQCRQEKLKAKSKLIGYMTLDQYRGFHKALLNQRHGIL